MCKYQSPENKSLFHPFTVNTRQKRHLTNMKTVLKLIGGLLIGITAGFVIAAVFVVLFTDTTIAEFINNMLSTDKLKYLWQLLSG